MMARRDECAADGGNHDHDEYDDTDSAASEVDDGDTTRRRKRRSPAAIERPAPARKPTYLARKKEKEALAAQIRALEARLDALRLRAGLPTSDAARALAAAQTANAQIEERIHGGLLGLAEFQSLVARHLHGIPVEPMATFIHLPRDRAERLATLRAVRPIKLRRARELVLDRLRGLRATQPYQTEERFVSRDGDFHCRRIDLHPFRGACGARALFDALVHYLSNREISITEMLGQLTLREHVDREGAALWNHRVVSTTGAGYVQDLNTVGFAEFVDGDGGSGEEEGDEGDVLRGPYGVIAVDSVDEDELFPYEPAERVRKDVTAALLVCQVPASAADATPVVVLKRCVFVTVHRPQFPLPPSVMDEVVANVASWSTVMAAFVRDRHATPTAAS